MNDEPEDGDSGQFIWCDGLSCLFRFLNKTNEINQTNETTQMNQIPATRRGMVPDVFFASVRNHS